jgi:hypothetical protein
MTVVPRRPRFGPASLGLVLIAALVAPGAAAAAEPQAALPAFTCRIPHALASSALGVFASSLTLWTHVSDAPVEHVAAVVWLEPPILGALSGLEVAADPSGAMAELARP